MADTTEAVLYQSQDGIVTITINRPKQLNAIDAAVEAGLADAWQRFNRTDTDRVAILTGAGERAFSAGRDRAMTDPPDFRRFTPGGVIEVDKPIIAALSGWVVGGAIVLVQMADLCVAAENTRFTFPEARLGFGGGMIAALAGRIPHKIAMELMLLGEEISVQRAYEVGLVNRVVPVGEHLHAARAMAQRLAKNSPMVLRLFKRFTADVLPKGPVEKSVVAFRELDALANSADFQEGLAALREQRAPVFQGK